MKKFLSVLMAGAMVTAMAVPAFAAGNNVSETVYNEDGESNKDVWGHATVPFTTTDSNSITVDGVVPGITMYIPLGKTMNGSFVRDGNDGTVAISDVIKELDKKLTSSTNKTLKAADAGDYLSKDGKGIVTAIAKTDADLEDKDVISQMGLSAAVLTNNDIGSFVLSRTGHVFGAEELQGTGATPDVLVPPSNDAVKIDTDKYYIINDANAATAVTTATDALKDAVKWDKEAYTDDATGHYYKLASGTTATDIENAWKTASASGDKEDSYKISLSSLTNDDYFKFDVDKDEGSKYVKKIEVLEDKKLSKLEDRTAFLKVTLNESQTVDDLKSTGVISFKAKDENDGKIVKGEKWGDNKKDENDGKIVKGEKWGDNKKDENDGKIVKGEKWGDNKEVKIHYTFWINNVKKGNDDSVDTGDRVFFNPDSNEDNTLVWGDDRAALFFEGNDDASKFYARLQTKSDAEIYATYGDPVNADLWFYDFVGNPTIPSTSRAILTLGIPWDEDDDYTPNPEDCFIYEKDADGNLIDVTHRFTYSEDNDGSTEIPGWTIKTRTLGTYIISDTELDTTIVDEVEETEEPVTEAPTASTGKEIPNTGSSDMVGAAVVAAVVSLAAAGAVVCKKSSK